jgi:hypothetical protein
VIKINISTKLYQKWLAALRSGKYKQGKRALAIREDAESISYCCMGVLLRVKGNIPISRMLERAGQDAVNYVADKELLGKEVCVTLASMNDADSRNFIQIAHWIETHLQPIPTGQRKHHEDKLL